MMTTDDRARYAVQTGQILLPRDRARIEDEASRIWNLIFGDLDANDDPAAAKFAADVADAAADAYRRLAGQFWSYHDPIEFPCSAEEAALLSESAYDARWHELRI